MIHGPAVGPDKARDPHDHLTPVLTGRVGYEPDVLLLDEPFSALDEDLKEDLLRELKMELQISKPVIFVSHNKEEVNDLCDLKYKIKEGELV